MSNDRSNKYRARSIAKEAFNLGIEKKWSDALAMYNKAIQLDPIAEYYYRRAKVHYYLNEYQEAIEDCDKAIDDCDKKNELRKIKNYKGELLIRSQKYKEGINLFYKIGIDTIKIFVRLSKDERKEILPFMLLNEKSFFLSNIKGCRYFGIQSRLRTIQIYLYQFINNSCFITCSK